MNDISIMSHMNHITARIARIEHALVNLKFTILTTELYPLYEDPSVEDIYKNCIRGTLWIIYV